MFTRSPHANAVILHSSLLLFSFILQLDLLSRQILTHSTTDLNAPYPNSVHPTWQLLVCYPCLRRLAAPNTDTFDRTTPHHGHRPPQNQASHHARRYERCSRPQARRSRDKCWRPRRHWRCWLHTRYATRANRRTQEFPKRQECTLWRGSADPASRRECTENKVHYPPAPP